MSRAFKKETLCVASLNPDGSIKEDIIEMRRDPLTGHIARINTSRSERPHARNEETTKDKHKARPNCLFCGENWKKVLQRYHPSFWNEGWMRKGEIVLFPNKYPFGKHHSVLILGKKHRKNLSVIPQETWKDAFVLIKSYLERVLEHENWRTAYPYINLNFLSPSGASIDHPHMQILIEKKALEAHRHLLKSSKNFFQKNGISYWDWLKKNHPRELFIKDDKDMYLLAAFAPIANGEIMGIGIRKPLPEFEERELKSIAKHTSSLLKGFESIGIRSMNLTLMFPKDEREAEYFPTILRLIRRPDPEPFYTTDRGFVEIFYRENVVHIMPESIASSLRRVLSRW